MLVIIIIAYISIYSKHINEREVRRFLIPVGQCVLFPGFQPWPLLQLQNKWLQGAPKKAQFKKELQEEPSH